MEQDAHMEKLKLEAASRRKERARELRKQRDIAEATTKTVYLLNPELRPNEPVACIPLKQTEAVKASGGDTKDCVIVEQPHDKSVQRNSTTRNDFLSNDRLDLSDILSFNMHDPCNVNRNSADHSNMPASIRSPANTDVFRSNHIPVINNTNHKQNTHHTDTQPKTHANPDLEAPNVQSRPLKSKVRFSAETDEACKLKADNDNVWTALNGITEAQLLAQLMYDAPDIFDGKDIREFPAWMKNFEDVVETRALTPSQKIRKLYQYTEDKPHQMIKKYLTKRTDMDYKRAKDELEMWYGDKGALSRRYKQEIDAYPILSHNDNGTAILNFAHFVSECREVSEESGTVKFDDEEIIQKLVLKLPKGLRDKWSLKVIQFYDKNKSYPGFAEFSDFVVFQARMATFPVFGTGVINELIQENQKKPQPYGGASKPRRTNIRYRANALASRTDEEQTRTVIEINDTADEEKCLYCKNSHLIMNCHGFSDQKYDLKVKFIMKNGLCFGCLKRGHRSRDCPKKLTCNVCKKNHPTALHNQRYDRERNEEIGERKNDQDGIKSLRTKTSSLTNIVRMVPVEIYMNEDNKVQAYALLDEQSSTSFLIDDIRIKLGLPENPVNVDLATMTSESTVICNKVEGLKVKSLMTKYELQINCYTRDEIPHSRDQILTKKKAENYPSLRKIAHEIPKYLPDAPVCLLIGTDCSDAFIPSDLLIDPNEECYGIKTKLGWGVVGLKPLENMKTTVNCHKMLLSESRLQLREVVKEKLFVEPLDVVKCLERDFLDVKSPYSDEYYDLYGLSNSLSIDDRKFMKKCTSELRMTKDGHVEIPLPLRTEQLELPNNYESAFKRLSGIKKKLMQNTNYRKMYVSFMENLLENEYAEKVPLYDVRSKERIWYLPHFGVENQHKPGKVRVVFDCAAPYKEHSLNHELLPGPNLANTLLGVLIRFRQKKIAIMGDIESMFYQIRIPKKDRDLLRFLWWENHDISKPPSEYRMCVHPFGAASSPGCANLALKTVAHEFKNIDKDASEAIKKNCYVDDLLISVDNEDAGINMIKNARKICLKGGFNLKKFICNSKAVLESIEPEAVLSDVTSIKFEIEPLSITRALGIQWRLEDDSFSFAIDFKDLPLTRRGILATVSSVFDPFGFTAPCLLSCKLLLREICEDNKDWDADVSEELKMKWRKLRTELLELRHLKIPRCFKKLFNSKIKSYELHHFSDGSEIGYGQCTYLRTIDENDEIHCHLVIGKSRVAPIKPTTIPRIELTAALTSVRVANAVNREIELKIDRNIFWTDSKVVLGYVSNDAKRFKQFVANRVHEIRESTEPFQWFHIDGKLNPADDASRGLSVKNLLRPKHRYLNGPEFLMKPIIYENMKDMNLLPQDLPDVKVLKIDLTQSAECMIYEALKKFSCWNKARSFVAFMTKFKEYIILKHKKKDISSCDLNCDLLTCDLKTAEMDIIRIVQNHEFCADMKKLKYENSETVMKNSNLRKLHPFMDRDKVLRIGGRLQFSNLPEEIKFPILLPNRNFITDLIIRYYHGKTNHQGRGFTLQSIRSNGFWILHGISNVVRVIKNCVKCKILRGRTQKQLMADLPAERLNITSPFAYSAMDVYGPFIVKNKRTEIKRYGLIFTCMASRAVRLEVLPDMTTDCMINALRRFVCRNGPVTQLRCDCGTNFVGANNELRKQMYEVNMKKVKDDLLQSECDLIQFKFNVPHASHQGGVWERQIRTVRSVLNAILQKNSKQLNDDALQTYMIEAEAIVNGKPLTYETLNSGTDLLPITPNQLLTTKTEIVLPLPGNFDSKDLYAKKYWKRVQHLANEFWQRWRKEYRNTLQSRSKWNTVVRDMKIDDVVLLSTDEARNQWKIARVIKTYPDPDNHVRKVRIRLGNSWIDNKGIPMQKSVELDRPIHKLLLLVESTEE